MYITMGIEGVNLMWTLRLILMLLCQFLFLFTLPAVSGVITDGSPKQDNSRPTITECRQTQDNSNRLLYIEALLRAERSRLDAERLRTDSLQKELSEIKSQMNTLLSSLAARRPAYDDQLIKRYVAETMENTLDSIQDGLITEKNNRLQHDNMLLQIKDIVGRTQHNTNQMEDRIRDLEKTCVTIPKTGSITAQTKPTTSPTITQSIAAEEHVTPSPIPRITHNVQFSGQPVNQNDTRTAKSCRHLKELGYPGHGVYRVDITRDNPVLLYCHPFYAAMYVQRRRNRVTGFNKSWEEYKYGFGNSDSDHWIGNEILWHAINSSTRENTRLSIHYNTPGQYDLSLFLNNVQLSNEKDGYQLHYSRIKKSHGFPIDQIPINGSTFMTRDRQSRGGNCTDVTGGWWYQRGSGCATTPYNPNSRFYKNGDIIFEN